MNFSGKSKALLLVHAGMEYVTLPESVNVMLTPQFYTLKKEALPVKYAYQAKKIAPSLFEGLLEDGASYEYMVHKEGDAWAFIAYDTERITTFLESKGIPASKVGKIFFAQQAVDSFTAPLALSEKEALVVIEDTVVVVPRVALSEEEQPTLEFTDTFTPKSGITLKSQGTSDFSLFTQKQAVALGALFLLFGSVFAVEGSRYGGNSQESEEKLQSLYESYPALQSSYARQGIIDKYRTLDTSERKKRDTIKAFSGMIFKGVTLTSLTVNQKSFKAQFSCTDDQVANKLKALAKKSKYNISNVKGSKELSIEGTL